MKPGLPIFVDYQEPQPKIVRWPATIPNYDVMDEAEAYEVQFKYAALSDHRVYQTASSALKKMGYWHATLTVGAAVYNDLGAGGIAASDPVPLYAIRDAETINDMAIGYAQNYARLLKSEESAEDIKALVQENFIKLDEWDALYAVGAAVHEARKHVKSPACDLKA